MERVEKLGFSELLRGFQAKNIEHLARNFFDYDKTDENVRWPTDRIKLRRELIEMTPEQYSLLKQYNWICDSIKHGRHIQYDRIVNNNYYNGPFIISEGDSWFLYPLFLYEIIDWLLELDEDRLAIWSTGCPGDTLQHIYDNRMEMGEYLSAFNYNQPPDSTILLLSAGADDLLYYDEAEGVGHLARFLKEYKKGDAATDLLDYDAMDREVTNGVMLTMERLLSEMAYNFPEVTVITHGYDYAVPMGDVWLGKPMLARGIVDFDLQCELVRLFLDFYNEKLKTVVNKIGDSAIYVNLRGTVKQEKALWHDEIHPNSDGFHNLAEKLRTSINDVYLRVSI